MYKLIILASLTLNPLLYSDNLRIPQKILRFVDRDGIPLSFFRLQRTVNIGKRIYHDVVQPGLIYPVLIKKKYEFRNIYDKKTYVLSSDPIVLPEVNVFAKKKYDYKGVTTHLSLTDTVFCKLNEGEYKHKWKPLFYTKVGENLVSCDEALSTKNKLTIPETNQYYQDSFAREIICQSPLDQKEFLQEIISFYQQFENKSVSYNSRHFWTGKPTGTTYTCLDEDQSNILKFAKEKLSSF
jgi:hypothetical protein